MSHRFEEPKDVSRDASRRGVVCLAPRSFTDREMHNLLTMPAPPLVAILGRSANVYIRPTPFAKFLCRRSTADDERQARQRLAPLAGNGIAGNLGTDETDAEVERSRSLAERKRPQRKGPAIDKSLAQPGAAHVRAALTDPDIANLRCARLLRTRHQRPRRHR